MVVIAGCGLLGALVDGMLGTGLGAITGVAFIGGCLLAVLKVRPNALLTLVATPPLLFLAVIMTSELVRTWGSDGWLRNIALGLTTTLSIEAPWLFVGTGLVLVVAWFRGLRGNIRELRDQVRRNKHPTKERGRRVTTTRSHGDRASSSHW